MVEQCIVEGRWADLIYNTTVWVLILIGFMIAGRAMMWAVNKLMEEGDSL